MECYKTVRLDFEGHHSVKGQGLVCCHMEQSSQRGPQGEGRLEQSGVIVGTRTQTAFLTSASLVYQKAI